MDVHLSDDAAEAVALGSERHVAQVGPLPQKITVREYRVRLAELVVNQRHHQMQLMLVFILQRGRGRGSQW